MNRTTKTERLALIAIALGFLASGYLDGQDARLIEKKMTLACVHCAGER